nr:MAG TPA: hypothetical protein [Bacteriophage sp.]
MCYLSYLIYIYYSDTVTLDTYGDCLMLILFIMFIISLMLFILTSNKHWY